MRIQPIEKPRGLRARLAYAQSRRRYGTVISPLKVALGRVPGILPVYQGITRFMTKQVGLEPSLLVLIQAYTAGYNQCAFCIDITRSFAAGDPALLEKTWRVSSFATDPLFTDGERAALAYVAEATRDRRVSDATFATLRRYFSDTEIVEITLVNAIENFYNQVNGPLGIESDGFCALGSPGEAVDAPGTAG